MISEQIKRELVPQFSELSNKLAHQDDISYAIKTKFSLENCVNQISIKRESYSPTIRKILVQNISEKYRELNLFADRENQIATLADSNTFTVTTGHQLCLNTGPLYLLVKIINTIKLAKEIRKKTPEHKIIPIFWMATEDHDLAEIQHFSVFGKKIIWNTNQVGAVGKMKLENWDEWKSEVISLFANASNKLEIEQFLNNYSGENLSEANFKMIHSLFKESDLIIIDADNKALKQLFIPVIRKEIETQFAVKAVLAQNQILEQHKIKPQAFARDVNLFMHTPIGRKRISIVGEMYEVEQFQSFTKEEILALLEINPACFSPNVILRPLFQEFILPNLVYVGGGGEIAYWLQFPQVFEAVNIPFPLVLQRNSVLITTPTLRKKMEKLAITLPEMLVSNEQLSKNWISKQGNDDTKYASIKEQFEVLKNNLEQILLAINTSNSALAEIENTKLKKQEEALLQRLSKDLKQRFEIQLKQLSDLQEKIIPFGGLQERTSNFFNFLENKPISELLKAIEVVIELENSDLKVIHLD